MRQQCKLATDDFAVLECLVLFALLKDCLAVVIKIAIMSINVIMNSFCFSSKKRNQDTNATFLFVFEFDLVALALNMKNESCTTNNISI